MRAMTDILVADDSDHDVGITLRALRKAAPNAAVLRLTDGNQVLQFLFATGSFANRPAGMPRLVLLELWMPGANGMTVLEALRAQPATTDLAVVLLTSCSNPVLIERCLALGANDYKVKPQDTESYGAVVESIVSRWCGPTTPSLSAAESAA